MKKNKIVIFALLLAFSSSLLSCLKDKGYDNQDYGIQAKEVVGVSFPESPKSPILTSLSSLTTEQTLSTNLILESDAVASTDVVVQLVNNPTLVASSGYTGVPSGGVIIQTSATIKAGSTIIPVVLRFPNSTLLDATKTYAVGLSISSVSPNGYTIASNMKDIVIAFSIRNKYDGIYTLKGQFFHPSAAPGYPTFTTPLIELQTTGPNTVKLFSRVPGLVGFFHPWVGTTGGAFTAFGSQEPEFTVNPTTNVVTVQNSFPGAVTLYTMGKGFNNAGYNSRWVETSKTVFACFGYGLSGGGDFSATASRLFIDTLIRTGSRP